MISVIIPTLNAAARLPETLTALVPAAVDGSIKEVIIVDGGSRDETLEIADGFGATVLSAPPGRGGQLRKGAAAARGEWLLFLHGDTVLEEDWVREARSLASKGGDTAGVFTLRFDAKGLAPRFVAAAAMARTKLLGAPYGDQGLFVSRKLYDEVGGYADMALMEDVDIMGRIRRLKGARSIHVFRSAAITSATRYEREGYFKRVFKNAILLTRYHLGAAPERLAESYRK